MGEVNLELLTAIASEVKACTACPLHQTRTQAVPGEGAPQARVAFIGEAPGKDEDQQGRPFVGRSGQLLRQTIRDCGWREEEVFIGNVLKCRPPDNRDPEEHEIASCSHFLQAQLALINPALIVTLGRFSLNLLIDPKLKITQVRGQLLRKHGKLYLPTYHPSAVLRNPNLGTEFRRDIMSAKQVSENPQIS